MGISDRYGIEVGKQADLVILDTPNVANALLDLPPRSWVIKKGRVVLETKHEEKISKEACVGPRQNTKGASFLWAVSISAQAFCL
jgi:cytosine deaminase